MKVNMGGLVQRTMVGNVLVVPLEVVIVSVF